MCYPKHFYLGVTKEQRDQLEEMAPHWLLSQWTSVHSHLKLQSWGLILQGHQACTWSMYIQRDKTLIRLKYKSFQSVG